MTNNSSVEKPKDLVVTPPPQITGTMSKNRIMTYTFAALMAITIITAILWWPAMTPHPDLDYLGLTGFIAMPLGAILLLNALIAVGVAVISDLIIGKAAADSEVNTMSAAVFGLIVALSYSIGVPMMAMGEMMPISTLCAPGCFIYVALISFIGLVVFKKLQSSLIGRKLVNPAATAKLLVLLPFLTSTFIVKEHWASLDAGGIGMPKLASNLVTEYMGTSWTFADSLKGCYGLPGAADPGGMNSLMLLTKFHGWPGGASSIAVIIIGAILIFLLRDYFKWRITATYLGSVAVMSAVMFGIYGGDLMTRLLFGLFVGSSIFLAFFMATDPASTPYSRTGQIIFGIGLGVLTVLIQTYMNFFGGALLALVIMNLTVPLLDRIRIHKPFGR
ncbi:MAG: RnfABCDGE type electron transport complex subunit D [Nitrososphaerota archaeon]|jgi:Na+-translocating ferredoxin:NAD+ oxidoreductase RnfD subunit|nr:RnfABCDGE type electron transport complex subunit D [Nitrososphaerota archaeon]